VFFVGPGKIDLFQFGSLAASIMPIVDTLGERIIEVDPVSGFSFGHRLPVTNYEHEDEDEDEDEDEHEDGAGRSWEKIIGGAPTFSPHRLLGYSLHLGPINRLLGYSPRRGCR
jgi:hypothetical protein